MNHQDLELESTFESCALSSRFQPVRVLGRGGMGTVFHAIQRDLDRPVALKVMSVTAGSDEVARARFHREARLASQVRHPAVVEVYLHGETPTCLFIAYRLVEGHDLRERLPDVHAQDPIAIARFHMTLLEGLEAIHREGILHRDLKPENVLLQDLSPVITDLGISRALSESPITRPGEILGTPLYMAPEVIRGTSPGAASDLYAVGLMLVECLTGRHPFSGMTGVSIMRAHLDPDPGRRLQGLARFGTGWMGFLRKSLDLDPAHRFGSASEMRLALEDLIVSDGVREAPDPGRHHRATRRIQESPHPATAQLTRAQANEASPAGPRARSSRLALPAAGIGVFAVLLVCFCQQRPPPQPIAAETMSTVSPAASLREVFLERLRRRMISSSPAITFFPDGKSALFLLGPWENLDQISIHLSGLRPGTRVILNKYPPVVADPHGGATWHPPHPRPGIFHGPVSLRFEPGPSQQARGGVRVHVGRVQELGPRDPRVRRDRLWDEGLQDFLSATGIGRAKDRGVREPRLREDRWSDKGLQDFLSVVGGGHWPRALVHLGTLEGRPAEQCQGSLLLAYLYLAVGIAQRGPMPQLTTPAFFAEDSGENHGRAQNILGQAISRDPEDGLAWALVGRVLLEGPQEEVGWDALRWACLLETDVKLSWTLACLHLDRTLPRGGLSPENREFMQDCLQALVAEYPSPGSFYKKTWKQELVRLEREER